ncbi:MAG: glycosyltransferase [Microscillaceae bacterium]|jgi:glycosyltransferase involved in cell wall biosynthesis|nr:glycosyltransferase [Microscillaceae bacterium]
MEYPKITIITPSFNQGIYIEECILSVLGQNYPNLEYFIIDGASTDHTVEIIQKYASKIDYWVSKPDAGQSDAINKGLRRASGEIINWLNADDIYEPDALWKIARAFQDSTVQVVSGRCKILPIKPNQVSHYSDGTDIYPHNLAKTIGWARTDQPATFYRAEAVRKMNELDIELHYLMDRDWWVKYLLHFGLNHIVKIPDVLVNFRLHPASKTITSPKQFHQDRSTYFWALAKKCQLLDYQIVIEKNELINPNFVLKNFPPITQDLAYQVLNYYCLLTADEYYAQNQIKQAKKYLKAIKPMILAPGDRHLYKKLLLRSSYLPLWLIKWLRFLKN